MGQGAGLVGLADSTLVRLLARLAREDAGAGAPASAAEVSSTAERLGHWLGWTDAIALSSALSPGESPAAPVAATAPDGPGPDECRRVRRALAQAVEADGAFGEPNAVAPATRREAPRTAMAPIPEDFSAYRQRYLARQQAMEAGIGPLREGLRHALATRVPALAGVDAVMAQVLGAQEQRLLAGLPAVLERQFRRLRGAAEAELADGVNADTATVGRQAWLAAFRRDARALLLAELDFRFQPVDGLLQALGHPPTGP